MKKPESKIAISGILISSMMLSSTFATPVLAANADLGISSASDTQPSAVEMQQFRALVKQNIVDVELLKGIYRSLTQIVNSNADEFINTIGYASICLDHLDISAYSLINGTEAEAIDYYDKSVNLRDSLISKITFTDVSTSDWFCNDVRRVASMGIINGVGNSRFAPEGNLTVAQAIKLVAAAKGYYNDELDDLLLQESDGHWVQPFVDYAVREGILSTSDFKESDYDTNITRGEMVELFARALPEESYIAINDFATAPEQSSNAYVIRLYESGIFVGDAAGFRLNDVITRAEISAIINRLVNEDSRVLVTAQQGSASGQQGSVASRSKIAPNPRTWYVTPAVHGVAQKISATPRDGFNKVDTLYNHTYLCANQEEYDAVVGAVQEAYDYVTSNYTPGKLLTKYYDGEWTLEDLKKQGQYRGIINAFEGNIDKIEEVMGIYDIYSQMRNYLQQNYIKKRPLNSSSPVEGSSAYSALFGGDIKASTCESLANLGMIIWDVMGYNSTSFGSTKANHVEAAVQIDGTWFMNWVGFATLDVAKTTHSDLAQRVYDTKADSLYGYSGWLITY